MPSSSQATTARPLGGRVAWITGASRGLGRSLALSFAEAGAELALTSRSPAPLEELCETVRAAGGSAWALPGSITDPAFVAAAVAALDAEHGRLDVLVNNAGISPYFKWAEQLATAEVREVIETNLLGTFECCRAAADLLAAAPQASVVNVSSPPARSSSPDRDPAT